MRKNISNILCFIIVICLLATGSITDFSTSYGMTTITEAVSGDNNKDDAPKRTAASVFASVFGATGFNKNIFKSQNPLWGNKNVLAAGDGTILVAQGFADNQYAYTNSTKELTQSDLTIGITKINPDGSPAPFYCDGVTFTSSNPNVVSIIDNDDTDLTGTLHREGPGTTAITATFREYDENGKAQFMVFQFNVHVEFTLLKTSSEWVSTGLDAANSKILVLDTDRWPVGTEYPLDIKYVDRANINTEVIDVVAENPNYDDQVVKYQNGKLKIVGAGFTEVTLSTQDDNPDTCTFSVLVTPRGSLKENNPGYPYRQTISGMEGRVEGTKYFTLYTNTAQANNLIWKVYSVTQDGTEKLLGLTQKNVTGSDKLSFEAKDASGNTILEFEVSDQSGVVHLRNVKAGTYKILALSSDKFDLTFKQSYIEYDITVLLSLKGEQIFMNVGDTYSMLDNTNIPVAVFKNIYTVTSTNTAVADIDTNNGIITAYSIGRTYIKFKYNSQSGSAIFEGDDNNIEDVVYTVDVIDAISINDSKIGSGNSPAFEMYVGADYRLYANVTNTDYDVYWKSSDESVATIEDMGSGSAMVKALKKGKVTITAYQIIEGVEKKATCTITIKESITNVKLDPSVVEIEVGDYKTIVARVTGDASELRWVSSDASVFTFVDGVDKGSSVTIQALKPGKAMLTCINPDNIVCGYCEVNVFQNVTGLNISESKLTLKENSPDYQLYAYVLPQSASDSSVVWSTTNPSVVTVDEHGKLHVVAAGEAVIVCQSVLNPEFITYCNVTVLKAVTGISFDKHAIELYKGEDYRLSYVIRPTQASNIKVSLSTFDASVATATVSEDYSIVVKAVAAGKTNIMIMTDDGKYWDLVEVTVKQVATGVKMNYTDVTMSVGEFFDMTVTLTPADATERSLTWESLTPDVATVSSTGRITGLKAGNAIILAKTQNGQMAYCNVTVVESAIALRLDPAMATIEPGETLKIDPIFTPEGTTNKAVVWTSSDPSVATVNAAGMVTGIKGGVTVIECKTEDGGYSAFCLLKVEEPIVDITIIPEEYILGIGKYIKLQYEISNSSTASDVEVEWYSTNEKIATVDKSGKVVGVSLGECDIVIEAVNGYAKAICHIQVVKEVSRIKLNYSTKTILVGHNFTLKSTVYPEDATYKDVTYEVSDDTIVMVDSDGVVTGLKAGTAWVTASAQDNSGKYAKCYVTVINEIPATGITLSDTELIMLPGEKKTVSATLKPTNSTDGMSWISSNDQVATVNSNGTITAKAVGTATITVMTTSGKTATISVTVLGLSRTYLEMKVYTQYSSLEVFGAAGPVKWDVDDVTICDVNNGVVTARKVGTTKITATYNGRKLSCTIKVVAN